MSVCSTVGQTRFFRNLGLKVPCTRLCKPVLFHFRFSILAVYVTMVTAMVGTNEISTRQKIEEKGFNIFGLMTCSLQYKYYHEIGGKSGV